MTASPATRPVTDTEIAAFHRDGAVLLRGVLVQEWLDLVADGLEECFAERDHHSSEVVAKGATVRADQLLAARSASLRRFADESPVGGLVGSVLAGPVRFYMDQMFFRRAGPMAPTPWHQDISYHNVEGEDSGARLGLTRPRAAQRQPRSRPRIAPLGCHVPPDGGARPRHVRRGERAPDGHRPQAGRLREGRRRVRLPPDRDGQVAAPTPDVPRHRDSFDVMGWDYEPGDVILFHGNLLHGAPEGVILERDRRAYAALFAGPRTRYVQRLGQAVPDPPALTEQEPQTGQTLESFGDVFPLVWSPGDWD